HFDFLPFRAARRSANAADPRLPHPTVNSLLTLERYGEASPRRAMRQRRCRASGGKLAGFVRVNGVSSAEFRQIENRSGSDKADRLFRVAVSAFAGLRRP